VRPSAPAIDAATADGLKFPADDVSEVADALAGLASALSARLQATAQLAADNGDRTACQNAARDADRIGELLAGSR